MFTDQHWDFMLELIDHDPTTLELKKFFLKMFHETGILVCLATIASDFRD
ncbi:hypothetical protein CROQUDRAFT_700346 [Cronartium quercuum f. sp. fusiforme G11]|uniref:Uncharacterized protein n=1 Tax=Cronartium quercuum f. sp. fusiforme G11 TaxID=708437 RepID=A0A9P6N529_9BASI|nr:hypothetical protein CROQUDRAFT_700346 [Cronartium quercuum f. sp. fusiforme G11]